MKLRNVLYAIGVLLVCADGTAQTNSLTPAPTPVGFDKLAQEIKNPVSWLKWGGDVRLRNEYFNNALTLSQDPVRNEQDYFRLRERLWLSISPLTDININGRVAGEQRDWMKPTFVNQFGNGQGMETRYGIVDQANLQWTHMFGLPLTITGGRQDIQLGDPLNWWLVCDGTPYDGSWTLFLDSIRATYDVEAIKTKFELIYIHQGALPDEMIPTIGRSGKAFAPGTDTVRPYWLTEQNEQGVIFYASNKSVNKTQIDTYFIYKGDSQEDSIRSPYGTPLGDNADIYTFGGKVTGTPFEHWKYSVEGAYQFGDKQDPTVRTPVDVSAKNRDIDAFGVNTSLTYLFKDQLNNQVSLIFEYLSGDDPKTTGKDEMFDVLWGRWPRWSELYIYSYPNETSGKFAQMNNLIRFGPNWTLTPWKNTTFSTTYNSLFSEQSVPTRAITSQLGQFSETGNFRGHYLQAFLKHKFNDHISAHLWGEFVWMGDYYAHNDRMTFLRAELMFTF